jgi:hypothetical protein
MLPERRQNGNRWEPSVPLILGAWNVTSNLDKMVRLVDHIEWGEKHGVLAKISAFLHGLEEADWHHLGE